LPGRPSSAARRWWLWGLLVALIVALLAMLMWLATRFESSQVQGRLERDASEAVSDIRSSLLRNVQALQALQARSQGQPERWAADTGAILRDRRELLRIEWRNRGFDTLAQSDTPHRAPLFDRLGRANALPEVQLACTNARRASGPAYAPSYFVPQSDGLGLEVMELCLAVPAAAGAEAGYLVATYSLNDMLTEMVGKQLARNQDVMFTEPDGTRLAFHGVLRRGERSYSATQLMDLPGYTLVLRLDSWRGSPDLFPNFLTAMVAAMTLALASVLVLLARDTRRRLRAERGLAEALAFRKAMEDSLVTGLRARDQQGQTTYVNPAFCQMVGFSVQELLQSGPSSPYWPPDMAQEYRERQAMRQAGSTPPREGFESVFMRKDGSRFPVMVFEAPLIDALGRQAGWMSAVLDIGEQRRVEELSRASQERLQATARLATAGEMASLLSHELNQPLAAIASYATGSINMLQDSEVPEHLAQIIQALQQIAEQSQRAGRVIKSVHDFVRRREQVRELIAPGALIEAVMPLISLQARKLSVRIQTTMEPGLPAIWCDRTMLEQVLLNLARNAMQAMDQQGLGERRMVLQVRRAASHDQPAALQAWIDFSVSDSGPGIADDVMAKLFTPFFTTKTEGMGLGLSLCRTVVEQHGGLLTFTTREGLGTVFTFTLPGGAGPLVSRDAAQP
jgi:two-component system sensor histidine kinase DctS